MLDIFYSRTSAKEWASLFDQIGRSLKSTPAIPDELRGRIEHFFETRLAVANSQELREFTFWLKAESLTPKWRLQALSRILDITGGSGRSASMFVEQLRKLAADETELAVECLAKIAAGAMTRESFYLSPEPTTELLKIGLTSRDPKIVKNAEDVQDNLLRAGYLEYLDV